MVANLVLCYLAPLCVITFCYILIWRSVAHRSIPGERLGYHSNREAINKSRLKVTKMVFVVIITFALSWMPLYCIFGVVKFRDEWLYDDKGQGNLCASLFFGDAFVRNQRDPSCSSGFYSLWMRCYSPSYAQKW